MQLAIDSTGNCSTHELLLRACVLRVPRECVLRVPGEWVQRVILQNGRVSAIPHPPRRGRLRSGRRPEEERIMTSQGKPGIVLVHGIWADGSCFNKVIPALRADGH
jgi:hypothetical protein